VFGSEALEIGIGMILVYLLLALVVTVVVEWIARILAMRSKTLRQGIESLLDGELAAELYKHPLISGYARKSRTPNPFNREPADVKASGSGMPSYIPSHLFALALLDVLPGADGTPQTVGQLRAMLDALPPQYDSIRRALLPLIDQATAAGVIGPQSLDELRAFVNALPEDSEVKKGFLPLLDRASSAGDELAAARESIEKWFDNAMDRVSGQYKRKAQLITIIVAFVVVGILNADSIAVADSLKRDPALRSGVDAIAAKIANDADYQNCLATPSAGGNTTATCGDQEIQDLEGQVASLGLPLGWTRWKDDYHQNPGAGDIVYKVVGLLLTGFAVSLGAPFWFDVLKRFVNVRAAGAVPEKSKEE
jgi:hypothetical protein